MTWIEGGRFSGIMPRPIHLYVSAVLLLGLGGPALLDWSHFLLLDQGDLIGLAALTALGLLSESLALAIRFGESTGHSSITFLPLLACVLVFGPAPAVLFIGITGLAVEFLIRGKELIRAAFNLGQYLLATTLAGLAFQLTGGVAQVLATPGVGGFDFQFLPFTAFAVVFLLTNQILVSVAIALHQGIPIRTVVLRMIGSSSGTAILYDLLVAPIAVAVAFLYVELGIPGLLVLILPLLFIRHSYLTYYRLLESNRNLLKALVKAIETRDPYTSGHSLRVALLARRIAEELGFPPMRVERIETAALVHDIGKIDHIFSDILSKAAGLTASERDIIESHVTRGVEILESVSSFPQEILDSVRHHHERLDGRGYPDGLKGDEIPIGARIIGTCDAIDAMLSDRPYREALSIPQVCEQLLEGRGTQFDEMIVKCVVESGLLTDHEKKTIPDGSAVERETFEVSMPQQRPPWRSVKRPQLMAER